MKPNIFLIDPALGLDPRPQGRKRDSCEDQFTLDRILPLKKTGRLGLHLGPNELACSIDDGRVRFRASG